MFSTLKSNEKSSRSSVGAPAQHGQASRKGKKAWRKNVDLEEVEVGLEGMRAEERVTGKTLQKTVNDELFVVDTVGDEQIRKTLPHRFSTSALTSTKILSQRSAVPAVFSRVNSTNAVDREKKRKMSREEKDRLLRIAKRPEKGPFNAVMDPSEYQAGHGVVELSGAVKESGGYDPWNTNVEVEGEEDGVLPKVKKVKAPATTRVRDQIAIPAVSDPHPGISYNPPVNAHQELIAHAAAEEEKRLKEQDNLAKVKVKMEEARLENSDAGAIAQGAAGMKIDEPVDEDVKKEEEDTVIVGPHSRRKTKVQRNKETKLLAEKRALAQKAADKRFIASLSLARGLRRTMARSVAERELEIRQKKSALKYRLRRHGLAGQRLGRHKVPEGRVDVQLGEDLTETLRGLKPEGNLFRDRFLSLQQRALIEPRVPVLPKKRKIGTVEYEKHAWKRFE